MKPLLFCVIVCVLAGGPVLAEEAAKLYEKACRERAAGNPKLAIQTVAQVIALHTRDKEWLAKSELLSAELYLELGLLDAADVTARQVQALYADMAVAGQAAALRLKIERLKEDSE